MQPSVQSEQQLQALTAALQQAVDEPNEIDFCGLVRLDSSLAGKFAIVASVGGVTLGREVSSDMVASFVEVMLRIFEIQPFDTYRLDSNRNNIIAWQPIWRAGHLESEKKYGGWFLLYVSATPQGSNVMNTAIQKRGPEHVALARRYVDAV